MKNKSHQTLFMKYLSPSLFVIVIIFAIFILLYQSVINSIKKETCKTVESTITNNVQNFNNSLEYLVKQANRITVDFKISHAMSTRENFGQKTSDYYDLMMCNKYLGKFDFDSYVLNYYMVSNKSSVFLSNTVVDMNVENVYGYLYQVDNMDLKEWKKWISGNVKNEIVMLPEVQANAYFSPGSSMLQQPILHYVIPIQILNSDHDEQRYFVYMLDCNAISKDVSMQIPDSYIVLSWNGKHLSGKVPHSAKNNYTTIHADPPRTNLSVDYYVPNSYINDMMYPTRRAFFLFGIISIVLALIISILLAYKESGKIRKAYNAVKYITPTLSELSFLDDVVITVDDLHKQVLSYQDDMVILKSSLKTGFLRSLINGDFSSKDEDYCRELLDLQGYKCFFCSIFKLQTQMSTDIQLSKLEIDQEMIRDYVETITDDKFFIYKNNSHKLTLVFCFNKVSVTEKHISALQEQLKDFNYPIGQTSSRVLYIEHGPVVNSIEEIYESALNANNDINNQLISIRSVISTYQIKMNRIEYALDQADKQDAHSIFTEIAENLECDNRDIEETQFVFYKLRMMLEDKLQDYKVQTEIYLPAFSKKEKVSSLIYSLEKIALQICDEKNKYDQNKKCSKDQYIIQYIDDNYSDPELCAANIAEEFSLSEKYIFHVVKCLTGKTLGEYIKGLRFQQVEKLLLSDIDIKSIPGKTGFYSVNTFYKAFKRAYGMPPGEWKKEHINMCASNLDK